jgi:hypothetical protein
VSRVTNDVMTPEQQKSNRRMAVTLACIAVLIFVGFMVKSMLLGV